MARKRYKPEEIVAKLRQVDVLVSQGQNMVDAIRQIGVRSVNVRKLLTKLVKEGAIERASRGRYQLPGAKSEPPKPERPKPAQAPKQGGNKRTRAARPRSDDMIYDGPVIEPPDQGVDPLDEHGERRKQGSM